MAIYDVGLFVGHGFGDPGACANGYKENEVARKIVMRAIEYISGKLNVNTGENNYLKNYTSNNNYTLKYALTVHLNSGGGTGSEAFVPLGEKEFDTEINILKGLETLGLKNRGVKSRDYNTEAVTMRSNGKIITGLDYYKEIRQAWPKTSLTILEVGFIDNKGDINLIVEKIDDIAFLIARELCKLKGIDLKKPQTQKPPVNNTDAKAIYRVVVDNNKIGSYAEATNIIKVVNEGIGKGVKAISITKV